MRVITSSLLILLSGALSISQSSCKSYANVTCSSQLEDFQSKAGTININQFSLGDVILMDTVNHQAAYVLHFVPGTTSQSTTLDSTVAMASSNFSVDLSGQIQEKGASAIQAEAKTQITNGTVVLLQNSKRQNIDNVAPTLNQGPNLQTLIPICNNNRNIILMVVSGLVYGDKFKMGLDKSVAVNANANIIQVGQFKVNVSYSCSNLGQIAAKGGALFYKAQFYQLDRGNNLFVQNTFDIDLLKYKFVVAAYRNN